MSLPRSLMKHRLRQKRRRADQLMTIYRNKVTRILGETLARYQSRIIDNISDCSPIFGLYKHMGDDFKGGYVERIEP